MDENVLWGNQNDRSLKMGVLIRIGRSFGPEPFVTISSISIERIVHKNKNDNENFITLNYSWFKMTIWCSHSIF